MPRFIAVLLIAIAAWATGCSGGGLPSSGAALGPATASRTAFSAAKKKAQFAYWTLYAGRSYPEVQIAKTPMKAKSKVVDIDGGTGNLLNYTSGVTFDSSGHAWILTFGKYGGNPVTAVVFKTPLKPSSSPLYEFVLSGTDGADALAFDPSGDLWVSSPSNNEVLEYTGPFTKSGTLDPAITLDGGSYQPYGVAFDKKADLYISIAGSTGSNSIAVSAPPYKGTPFFLNGLSHPGSLLFDKDGNLYSSTNAGSPAVVRYDSNDLKKGDKPSVVDPTGLPSGSYLSAFAFTAAGDLYVANCGNSGSAGIDVYPTGRKSFSAKLAPSLLYTNSDIQEAGCAWGIAIH